MKYFIFERINLIMKLFRFLHKMHIYKNDLLALNVLQLKSPKMEKSKASSVINANNANTSSPGQLFVAVMTLKRLWLSPYI